MVYRCSTLAGRKTAILLNETEKDQVKWRRKEIKRSEMSIGNPRGDVNIPIGIHAFSNQAKI